MIQKKYLKTKDVYRTTFRLPKEVAETASTIELVGEFNDWGKSEKIEMKKLKNGTSKAVIDLPRGEYSFKYCLDSNRYENDSEADKYVDDTFGGQNSVISLN